MRKLFFVLLVALPATAEDLAAQIAELARPSVDRGVVVGLAMGVVEAPGKEPLVLGFGKVSKDGTATPDQDTVYEIGSVSKVFTGVLLAALVEDGAVRLDQPVAKLLPDTVKVPAFGERKITLVDLSTHTSALPRMPGNFAPKDPTNPYADYTPEQMYAFISVWKLPYEPGKNSVYSNLAVGLLGHALALKAKQSYEELLLERIAKPLGMESTRVVYTDAMKKRLAPPYGAGGVKAYTWDIPAFAGAGGIRSTVRDMLKFLRASLSKKESAVHTAIRKSHEVQFKPPQATAQKMALGWHVDPAGFHWHNGQTGGYHCFLAVDVTRGNGVVILANTSGPAIDILGRKTMGLLRGEKPPKAVTVAAAVLHTYAGSYRLTPQFVLTVTVENRKLMVQATGQAKLSVFAESETKFFYKVVDAQITFVKEKGKVVALVLHQHGQAMRAPKE